MQRVSKRILDPHVPLITKAAISALNPRLKSAKAQMEALTVSFLCITTLSPFQRTHFDHLNATGFGYHIHARYK
jgi:hypothetical protein